MASDPPGPIEVERRSGRGRGVGLMTLRDVKSNVGKKSYGGEKHMHGFL